MNKFIYNFPLDPNSNFESQYITALYLYGENAKIDANGKLIIPQYEELLDSKLIRQPLVVTTTDTKDNEDPVDWVSLLSTQQILANI